jgi:hypothetical protein
MNSVVRNVADLSADERHLYESVLGETLQENQRVIVQLVNNETCNLQSPKSNSTNILEPYAMWADFSDDEIAKLESAILDRSDSRPA